MKLLLKRAREDKGASNTISFIIIMLFVMTLLVSFIDIGLYFNVKSEMRTAAENGARNVALYGGTGGDLRDLRGATDAETIVWDSISTNYAATKTVVVEKDGIVCGISGDSNNTTAKAAGDAVECSVSYQYKGLAGDFSIFGINDEPIVVKGVAVAEVGYKR